jgi:ubiquinone/menaquinone biosynthesis C-methylase UbiE
MTITEIQKTYDKWAKIYDRDSLRNPAIRISRRLLIPILNPKKNDVILEIGCGTGRVTLELSRVCKKVVAVDFSKRMLEVAKAKSGTRKNIEFYLADIGLGLPQLNACSFDRIVCPLLIDHIGNIRKLFIETHRLLKEGGVLVFDDINPDAAVYPVYRDLIFDRSLRGKKIFYHHTIDSLVHTLHRTGFEIEQIKFARVDRIIQDLVTRTSYSKGKGRTFGVVFKARKSIS